MKKNRKSIYTLWQ